MISLPSNGFPAFMDWWSRQWGCTSPVSETAQEPLPKSFVYSQVEDEGSCRWKVSERAYHLQCLEMSAEEDFEN